jgi:hypothetical protein
MNPPEIMFSFISKVGFKKQYLVKITPLIQVFPPPPLVDLAMLFLLNSDAAATAAAILPCCLPRCRCAAAATAVAFVFIVVVIAIIIAISVTIAADAFS